MTSLTPEMKTEIEKIWDALHSGGIANPLNAMEQISYFLFFRRLLVIDEDLRQKSEFTGIAYTSIFDGFEKCRWDFFKHLDGDSMLIHVRDFVFPWLKNELAASGDLFAKAMEDAVFSIPKGSLMIEMVNRIDRIYQLIAEEAKKGQSFIDIQGDMYEEFLSAIASAGTNGQFRTPRHIIQMIATIIDPEIGETVCDPSGGTAGFLLGAYHKVLEKHTSTQYKTTDRFGITHGTHGDLITKPEHWDIIRNDSFFGFDFDTTMVRLGVMNLMVHGLTNPRFKYQDTMSKSFNLANHFDIVLANPPFTGNIDEGDIWEGSTIGSTKTELLFIDRIVQLLKPGGRAAVIVPDGVLYGTQSKAHVQIRKMLVEKCGLTAMISLPPGVFKPYAGVSTGILIFTKGNKTEKVWFYDIQADGLSLDDKRDEVDECDIPDLLEKWESLSNTDYQDRKSKAFFVGIDEIVGNEYDLSLNRYKEISREEIQYKPPLSTIDEFEASQIRVSKELGALKEKIEQYHRNNGSL
jgi:type I restriction enzyme M protein